MSAIKVDEYSIQLANLPVAFPQLLSNEYSKTFLLTDEITYEHCYKLFGELSQHQPDVIVKVPAGELHKNLDTCISIWNQMLNASLDRHSLTINLGGGVICDVGGFCASTFMRGMDFVSIPTTLLAQVDASLGGKVGVDFKGYKNLLGIFRNPREVYLEYQFLHSLPKRQLQSGYVEILKHLLIASPASWEKAKNKPMPEIELLPALH